MTSPHDPIPLQRLVDIDGEPELQRRNTHPKKVPSMLTAGWELADGAPDWEAAMDALYPGWNGDKQTADEDDKDDDQGNGIDGPEPEPDVD